MSRVKYKIRPQLEQVTISFWPWHITINCCGNFMWQPPQALCSTLTTTLSPLLLSSRS